MKISYMYPLFREDISRDEWMIYPPGFTFYKSGRSKDLIDLLRKNNLLLAIVSASPREKLDKTVPNNFLEKFDVIISGDDVQKGKPNPEPYLKACTKLNLSPGKYIVVENAPLGIKSAKSAGAYCIAITTTLDKEYLKEADETTTNFIELKNSLLNIC